MTLRPATDIFDLSSIRRRPVKPISDVIGPAVERAFARERALPRRRIYELDGEILSQYVRLCSINSVLVRTANLDFIAWFSAGLDASPAVYLDPRILPLVADGTAPLAGHWAIAGTDDQAGIDGGTTAILADRADIIEFSDSICADVASGRYQFVFLHDVIDIISREFCSAASTAGVSLQFIPGYRSFAVFELDQFTIEARNKLVELIQNYACSISGAPEHLRPRVRKDCDARALVDAITKALARCIQEATAMSQLLEIESTIGPLPSTKDLTAQALARALIQFLDAKLNPVATLFDDRLRSQAQKVCEAIERSFELGQPCPTEELLIVYDILWQLLHIISSMAYHSLPGNKTMRLAVSSLAKCSVKPHAFKPFHEYIFFYRFQELQRRQQSTTIRPEPLRPIDIGSDVDHYIRFWQAVQLVEMLFMMIRRQRPDETIRWLDLGCGVGHIANMVRLEECLPDHNWEIIGVDWNSSFIRMATKRAARQRKFLVGDLKEAINAIGGKGFHIVSAFEVIEHLEDPVMTISDWGAICLDYLIAGSPREERPSWLPPYNHVWTFDRQGFIDILAAAGFKPAFANEAYVGSLSGKGADWLTVICGKNQPLPPTV
jgi:hypothetical protein